MDYNFLKNGLHKGLDFGLIVPIFMCFNSLIPDLFSVPGTSSYSAFKIKVLIHQILLIFK